MDKGLYFLIGGATGAGITWLATKKYYEKKADNEIEKARDHMREKAVIEKDDTEKAKDKRKNDIKDYMERGSVVNYAARYKAKAADEDIEELTHPTDSDEDEPYIISANEFGEIDDYEKVTLTYYQDGYLVEEGSGEVIEEVSELIGNDALESFIDDAVYVRNDDRETDYEILLSYDNFKEEVDT